MTTPAPPAARSSRSDNPFTRKIGPLPMWQWLLIALALVGVYVIYEYRKKNQAASAAASTGTTTGTTAGASQVPQFVNQTYTYGTAPAAPIAPAGSQAHKNWKGHPKPATGTGTSSTSSGTTTSTSTASPEFGYAGLTSQLGAVPSIKGMTLGQALSTLQAVGYGIASVTYNGTPLNQAQANQYYSWPVSSATQQGNQVALALSGSAPLGA